MLNLCVMLVPLESWYINVIIIKCLCYKRTGLYDRWMERQFGLMTGFEVRAVPLAGHGHSWHVDGCCRHGWVLLVDGAGGVSFIFLVLSVSWREDEGRLLWGTSSGLSLLPWEDWGVAEAFAYNLSLFFESVNSISIAARKSFGRVYPSYNPVT